MYSLSSIAVVALASLRLIPDALASPWPSSDPAPAPNGAATPRGLQSLRRDYDDEDAYDFHLKDDDDHQVWASLERTLGIIHEIPDEVLEKGDDETHKWLVKHGYRGGPKPSSLTRRDIVPNRRLGNVQELATRGIFDVLRCVGAIAAFIASNAIGAAKLIRIKKYIEALGGVKESAELLLKASNNLERLREGGEALALLAGEILGVPLITNNC